MFLEDCCNPYTNAYVAQTGDEEDSLAEGFEDCTDQDSADVIDDLAIVYD